MCLVCICYYIFHWRTFISFIHMNDCLWLAVWKCGFTLINSTFSLYLALLRAYFSSYVKTWAKPTHGTIYWNTRQVWQVQEKLLGFTNWNSCSFIGDENVMRRGFTFVSSSCVCWFGFEAWSHYPLSKGDSKTYSSSGWGI